MRVNHDNTWRLDWCDFELFMLVLTLKLLLRKVLAMAQ